MWSDVTNPNQRPVPFGDDSKFEEFNSETISNSTCVLFLITFYNLHIEHSLKLKHLFYVIWFWILIERLAVL
jgi:hypothetical protein